MTADQVQTRQWEISISAINKIVKSHDISCRFCGCSVSEMEIKSYPHDGGIPLSDSGIKEWVYFHCPKCDYDWALWKLLNKISGVFTRGIEPEVLESFGIELGFFKEWWRQ